MSDIPVGIAQEIKRSQICYYCKCSLVGQRVSMDHLVPRARGGDNSAGNIVGVCVPCNQAKGSMLIFQFKELLRDFGSQYAHQLKHFDWMLPDGRVRPGCQRPAALKGAAE